MQDVKTIAKFLNFERYHQRQSKRQSRRSSKVAKVWVRAIAFIQTNKFWWSEGTSNEQHWTDESTNPNIQNVANTDYYWCNITQAL